MKRFTKIGSAAAVAIFILSACVTPDAFKKEYKESAGVDLENGGYLGGASCRHYTGVKTPQEYEAARIKCAKESSGFPFKTEQALSYSRWEDPYEYRCDFIGYDRELIADRISKGVGLVQPVYIYGDDGAISVDWESTEKLIAQLKTKYNVRPIADSKAYHELVVSYRVPVRPANVFQALSAMKNDKGGNVYYNEIVSKLTPVDYIVAPSQDVVDAALDGTIIAIQDAFKLSGSAKNADDPSKKTFKPSEIQDMQNVSRLLGQMIATNAQNVKLDFQLTERLKSFNEKDETMTERAVRASIPRGCQVADLRFKFIREEDAQAKAAATDNKTFAQKMADMVQIDTSKGLDISLSNEQALRDQFILEQKKLHKLKQGYQRSMSERYQKINDKLVPFVMKAFDALEITGYTTSTNLSSTKPSSSKLSSPQPSSSKPSSKKL